MTHRLLLSLALILLPLKVLAWDYQLMRGIDLYSVTQNNITIRIVCDPNEVFGSSQSAIIIEIDANPALSDSIGFEFPSEEIIETNLVYGQISKSHIEHNTWQRLLEGFRSYTEVTIGIQSQTRHLTLGDLVEFSCR